jgi:hypothetical protein
MLVNKRQYSTTQKSWAHHNSVVWYTERPLTIVSFEVLIKEQPSQPKPLGLAITTAAFLPNTSKAPSNTERLVEPTAIKLRGELQAKQDLALKQGNDYYDYITGEVKSNANAAPIEFGIDASHFSNISSFEVLIKEHLSQ